MKSFLWWIFGGLPVLTAAAFLGVLSVISSSCYTLKQGTAMLGYLNQAVPLEEIAKGENATPEDLLFILKVNDIRNFAMKELGLAESKNYTRYVKIDRDYLAAVVSACADDSFTRHEWWFPVVGRVPYKGFFNPEDARKERAKLEKKRLDVWIRGVDAFSTLGWFKDPLYSYMKKYSERDLAELIIHELLHATVFLKNHTQFNEELAEFVGNEGARLYSERQVSMGKNPDETDEPEFSREDRNADRAAYLDFIRSLITELDGIYKSGISREEKLLGKEKIINEAKAGFEASYDTVYKTENYRGFSKLAVNNAYLELFNLYYEENMFYRDLYDKSGRDLPKFIAAAKTLKTNRAVNRGKGNPKEELERALLGTGD